MMESNERKGHTPGELKSCPYVISGPWTDDNGVTTVEIQIIGGHEVVAEIYADKAETALRMANEAITAWSQRAVNAELLAHLKFAVALLGPLCGGTVQVEAMRAAITKAEG